MSMHLEGPWVTTTRYNKKSKSNVRQQRANEEHEAWLRKQGLHRDQLKAKLPHDPKGRRKGVYAMPDYSTRIETAPTSDVAAGNGLKKQENRYTGDEIAGIGLLHKSNLVPVRKDSNDAKEIARMRRG